LLSHTAAYDQNGDRLGKYRLIAVLARGGMGDVYLATADGIAGFSKLLVVKELRADQADDDVYVNMFMDEARLAARLNHPNIVQAIEVGSDGPRRFLVMEYLDGQPLHRVLRRAGREGHRLTIGLRVRVLADVLEALAYAHTLAEFDGSPLGIVHRDVSPQIFLTYDGQVKLIDFGIAKTRLSSQQTTAGVLKGKVRYMAPEQARGHAVDARTDVFSCGVVLWELLLGQGPWEGHTELQVLDGLMRAAIPRLADTPPHLPQDLSTDLVAVVDRATSVAPGDRYPTARAMRDALLGCLAPVRRDNHGEELREIVASLFAEERRELGAIVDAQLREISSQSSLKVVSLTRVRTEESISSSARGARTADEIAAISGPSATPAASGAAPEIVITSISHRPRATGSHRGAIIILAAAIVVASAAIVWAVTGRAPEAPRNEAKTLAASAQAPSQTGTVDAPGAVHVTVRASPPSAKIYVDGVFVGNPYDARIVRDNVIHALVVEAPGYLTKTRSFSSAADGDMEIALERDPVRYGALRGPAEAPAHSSPPSPPSTAKAPSSASPDAPAVRAHRHRQVDKEDPYAQ